MSAEGDSRKRPLSGDDDEARVKSIKLDPDESQKHVEAQTVVTSSFGSDEQTVEYLWSRVRFYLRKQDDLAQCTDVEADHEMARAVWTSKVGRDVDSSESRILCALLLFYKVLPKLEQNQARRELLRERIKRHDYPQGCFKVIRGLKATLKSIEDEIADAYSQLGDWFHKHSDVIVATEGRCNSHSTQLAAMLEELHGLLDSVEQDKAEEDPNSEQVPTQNEQSIKDSITEPNMCVNDSDVVELEQKNVTTTAAVPDTSGPETPLRLSAYDVPQLNDVPAQASNTLAYSYAPVISSNVIGGPMQQGYVQYAAYPYTTVTHVMPYQMAQSCPTQPLQPQYSTQQHPVAPPAFDSSIQSQLCRDIMSGYASHLRLHDLTGRLMELVTYEVTSRFVQDKMTRASIRDLEAILPELELHFYSLITCSHGFYIILRYLEFASDALCHVLGQSLARLDIVELAGDRYAYRFLQRCLDMRVLTDVIVKSCESRLVSLACSEGGCSLLLRIMNDLQSKLKVNLLNEIFNHIGELCIDCHGHVIVRSILGRIRDKDVHKIWKQLRPRFNELFKQKYAHDVMSHLFKVSDLADQKRVIDFVLKHEMVVPLCSDRYGLKFVESLLELAEKKQSSKLTDALFGNFKSLAVNCYACGLLGRLFKREDQSLMDRIHVVLLRKNPADVFVASELGADRYGHSLICRYLETVGRRPCDEVIGALTNDLVWLAQRRWGAPLLEQAIEYGSKDAKTNMMQKVMHDKTDAEDGKVEDVFLLLLESEFGRRVIKRLMPFFSKGEQIHLRYRAHQYQKTALSDVNLDRILGRSRSRSRSRSHSRRSKSYIRDRSRSDSRSKSRNRSQNRSSSRAKERRRSASSDVSWASSASPRHSEQS